MRAEVDVELWTVSLVTDLGFEMGERCGTVGECRIVCMAGVVERADVASVSPEVSCILRVQRLPTILSACGDMNSGAGRVASWSVVAQCCQRHLATTIAVLSVAAAPTAGRASSIHCPSYHSLQLCLSTLTLDK